MRKKILAISLVTVFFLPQSVLANDQSGFDIIRTGDTELTCNQISTEITSMESVIVKSLEEQRDGEMTSTGVGVAKTVGGLLVGSLGGVLGIMAAGHLAAEAADDKVEEAAAEENAAAQRRSFMIGIYNAKGCQGPLQPGFDVAALEPAAGDDEPHAPVSPHYNP